MVIIYIRYKRKLNARNSESIDCKVEENVDFDERVDISSKRVEVDPNSTAIDFDKCNHVFDKSLLSKLYAGNAVELFLSFYWVFPIHS